VVNACFLPVIWFFYPETANRSLEEIDIIFAKGNVENMSYVKAADDLPFLTDEQVEREAVRYGLIETAERIHQHHHQHDPEKRVSADRDSEKAYDEQNNSASDEPVTSQAENAAVKK
jgi:hypothetical protein